MNLLRDLDDHGQVALLAVSGAGESRTFRCLCALVLSVLLGDFVNQVHGLQRIGSD
jgi:hypothetical protein